jgi:TRAP-type C4-dicarboxylate transport system substrate-binding protein
MRAWRNELLAVLLVVVVMGLHAQQYTIKFASISPEGTTWMNVMHEYDAAVRKESGGRMGFKMYAGMVQGDEKNVVRKIAVGQLHAAGFTGVGLGQIVPKIRAFDSPFLMQTSDEAQNLYDKFDPQIRAAFEANGYELLGVVEIGFVYVFTQNPIKQPSDVRQQKMWMWEGDPVAETTFNAMGIKPIPLSIDNVRTSLQTGLVNAFYSTPYAAISLQWYTQAKYVLDFPLTCSTGAVVISKRYFDTLPQDLKEILIRNGRMYMRKLSDLGRKDNQNALTELKKRGLIFSHVDNASAKQYVETGMKARRMLVGKLFDEGFLKQIEQETDVYRKAHKGK